jgi:hypothetical protein
MSDCRLQMGSGRFSSARLIYLNTRRAIVVTFCTTEERVEMLCFSLHGRGVMDNASAVPFPIEELKDV